jgi:agmatinase
MADLLINHRDPRTADVVLLAAPYDKTSSFGKGADQGPAALIDSFQQLELYERHTRTMPAARLRIARDTSLRIARLAPEKMMQAVSRRMREYQCRGQYVVLVGGEHTVSLGAFHAWQPQARHITIVQIDAHADLRDSDGDYNDRHPTRYAHSCVMRRAIDDFGFKTVQVGIRAYSHYELEYIRKRKLTVFEWGTRVPSVKTVISSIKTGNVYLTIDVDGLDPAFMPATGTPVQGGLEWYYTLELIQALFKRKNVVGADMVEIAPRPGDHLTEFGAAQLCYVILGCLAKKHDYVQLQNMHTKKRRSQTRNPKFKTI